MAHPQSAIGLSDLSRATGLNVSTAFRLLQTLMVRGYVEQEKANRTYFLGPRIFQMGSAYLRGSDLATIARPHVEALRDEVGETAYLVTFSQGEIVQLCKADGKQAVSAAIRPMVREPAYCTATGKVLLSALSPNEFDSYLQTVEMQSFTPRTLTSKSELRREIRTVREKGFALDLEEFVPNLCCVAIPLPRPQQRRATRCDQYRDAEDAIQEGQCPRLVQPDAREGHADHGAARSGRELTAHDAREGRIVSLSFLLAQSVSGLTAAMFLFIVASGLSLIFGVLRVLNFAHGSFYMLGAYAAWQVAQWIGTFTGSFWLAVLGSAVAVALLGGVIERLLLRHLYGRDDLYQLLFTYALVLILGDVARVFWGTQQLSVPRPSGLSGSFEVFGTVIPHYNLFIIVLGPALAVACWLLLSRTGTGRMIRAAAYDREMLAALGADVGKLYTLMFMAGSFLAGLAGALVTPVRSIVPGMDVDIIVEAFIVVVIGGLGSFWGTFLGALIFGQVLAFGILILPGFSIFAVFALMALVLVVRPSGLLGRPLKR